MKAAFLLRPLFDKPDFYITRYSTIIKIVDFQFHSIQIEGIERILIQVFQLLFELSPTRSF